MIGNTIEFSIVGKVDKSISVKIGLVIDAFTKVSGSVKGSSDSFLGCGSGNTYGKTSSQRIYKIEYFESWDSEKKFIQYLDIYDWQLKKIITYSRSNNAESI